MIIKAPYDPNCIKCGGTGDPNYFISSTELPDQCDCCTAENFDDGWFDSSMAEIIAARFFGGDLIPANVTTFVVHCGNTSADSFGGYFENPTETMPDGSKRWRRVSAHGAILDNGSWQQYVKFGKEAFHAAGHNDTSVGYELQGPPERTDWPAPMIAKLIEVINYFCAVYPLNKICSHRALAPLRRSDPGPNFPWSDLQDCFPTFQIQP
jgi:hypothetical protein